jgi:hypothetical protein
MAPVEALHQTGAAGAGHQVTEGGSDTIKLPLPEVAVPGQIPIAEVPRSRLYQRKNPEDTTIPDRRARDGRRGAVPAASGTSARLR